jgi:Cys-tRNA(Pro) deacylase
MLDIEILRFAQNDKDSWIFALFKYLFVVHRIESVLFRPFRVQQNFFFFKMTKTEYPVTAAVRMLREQGIHFTPRLYQYEEHGGTRASARELGVDEHAVIKTLVMESDPRSPLIVLMHGDREVSTKNLARALGVKQITPSSESTVARLTGYMVGGCSPFGTRTRLAVYAERTIFALPKILINGGKRGFLVEIDPADLKRALAITEVNAAIEA